MKKQDQFGKGEAAVRSMKEQSHWEERGHRERCGAISWPRYPVVLS